MPNKTEETIIINRCNELNIQFIKSYIKKGQTYIDIICPKHQNKGIQSISWDQLKKAISGCKYCRRPRMTTEDFKKIILDKNSNILILDEYVNTSTKIQCRCLIDGYEWKTTPHSLLSGYGCPQCGLLANKIKHQKPRNKLKNHNSTIKQKKKNESDRKQSNVLKTNEQFLIELKIANPDVLPLEQYRTGDTKIKCRCLIHNYEWFVKPTSLLFKKSGCPKCKKHKTEITFYKILEKYDIKYVVQKRFSDCKDKHTLPFDFYLTDYNILCEYDGEGHYQPIRRGTMTDEDAEIEFEKIKIHDAIKTEYCKQNNIPLIRVPYWERKNMECFLLSELSKYMDINKIKTA